LIISLEGKNALVCGSTQGIGMATAFEFANAKAHITLVARNEEKLKQLAKELPNFTNRDHDYICADFNNPSDLREKVKAYVSNNPPIHILVNNAGGPPAGLAIEAKIEEFQTALTNHLFCNQILVQTVVQGMKQENFGRIINIISTSVKQPIKGLGVSNTTRGAVASWAKTLATELAPFKITVNNVLPGATKTGRLESILKNRALKTNRSLNEIEDDYLSEIPAGRFASAEEVAYAIVFLASQQASYITGHSLAVDGGRIQGL
jgi:3-oxoacyl-[acyl-carrier protein] reductase